ncbi:MAG: hydrogenase nickel incorporation protein HypB [Bacteroidetes bacterium]|nr:hydrogenase nickel incorporation protein HypB [Bacteroidota bacterium]
MCDTCGCGNPDEFKIHDRQNEDGETEKRKNGETPHHDLDHAHDHTHEHDHHGHSHSHSHDHGQKKVISLNMDILSENNRLAERNRGYFEAKHVLALNMVSSPGSGKTSILERTIQAMIATHKIFVIEGDQQTSRDAERIEKTGAPAIQINTGSGCHLDAKMIHLALKKMEVDNNSILFIENVGNLVCPAMFDLGEQKRVVVISVTEGDDKPLKYPYMFQSSNLCIINKTDLLPYVDFRVETAMKYARQLNPDLEFILMSAKTGDGMNNWFNWLGKHAG